MGEWKSVPRGVVAADINGLIASDVFPQNIIWIKYWHLFLLCWHLATTKLIFTSPLLSRTLKLPFTAVNGPKIVKCFLI